MFNAASPSMPVTRGVPCLDAGGAPLSPASMALAYPGAFFPAARVCPAGFGWLGVFLQRHGRPSSLDLRVYSASSARRTLSINSRSLSAAH